MRSLHQQLGPDPQGVVGGVPHAKHPLVAPQAPHAPADLVGERLEAEFAVGVGEAACERVAHAVLGLALAKRLDRLLEPAVQKMLVARVGNEALVWVCGGGAALPGERRRQEVAVDRRKQEQRPHPLVEAFALPTESLEPRGLGKEPVGRKPRADALDRPVPHRRVGRRDDFDEAGFHEGVSIAEARGASFPAGVFATNPEARGASREGR